MPSSEGVPVDVVGRPSMGEGRTPGGVGAGGVMDAEGEEGDASLSAGVRESAMLRLRKAIVVVRGLGGVGRLRNCGRVVIDNDRGRGARRHFVLELGDYNHPIHAICIPETNRFWDTNVHVLFCHRWQEGALDVTITVCMVISLNIPSPALLLHVSSMATSV